MPKGKRGPRPDMVVTSEMGVRVIEDSFLPDESDDPTAETIVGTENLVEVGVPIEEQLEESSPMQCGHCSFSTYYLSEMEEHAAGTGHGRTPIEAAQAELFRPPDTIHRQLQIPLPEDLLDEKRKRLASLYQSALQIREEKKAVDDDCNTRLKNIDNQMQEIARLLRTPYTYETVDCQWRIIDGENARGCYRLDTGELIDKLPLSEEDRVTELEKASAANASLVSETLESTEIEELEPRQNPESTAGFLEIKC